MRDTFKWSPRMMVEKFDHDAVEYVARKSGLLAPSGDLIKAYGVTPYDVVEVEGNLLTTAGLTRLTGLLTGSALTALSNTSARIGVGNSSTAEAVGQTAMQGASQYYKIMDATYPQVSAGVVTLKSSFGDADANFVWAEWGVDIKTTGTATSGATVNECLLNRKVAALGTKASGTWALTVTITFS